MDSEECRCGVTAFVGPYGSGKTEVSINFALRRLAQGAPAAMRRVAIIDLDVVTPYFRTREVRARLEEEGLSVIAPPEPFAYADMPLVPPGARGAVEDESMEVVVDVGGDPAGARVFGALAAYARPSRLDVLFVVNACRPFTRTPGDVVAFVRGVEAAMGVRCTGLVSNTHLGPYTTAAVVSGGYEVARSAGRALGLDVVFAAVLERGCDTLSAGLDVEVLPIRRFMRPPWESEEGSV